MASDEKRLNLYFPRLLPRVGTLPNCLSAPFTSLILVTSICLQLVLVLYLFLLLKTYYHYPFTQTHRISSLLPIKLCISKLFERLILHSSSSSSRILFLEKIQIKTVG